jgi:ABC-type transport system involved in multi-copper enzyme maturation permease subunit
MTMESIRSRLFSPRLSRTGTIARFTLLEAWGTRLPWLWAAVLACIWAASLFVRQIAITESERLQWSFYASGVRLGAVLTLALYITSSMVREFNEKGLEMVLALDLSRGFYVAGKVAAFLALGVFLALAAAFPLAWVRPLEVVTLWFASLACELAIIGVFATFCVVSFQQVVPSVLLTAAFYLLARTIDALRLMSESAVLDQLGGTRALFEYAFEGIALLLPAFDRFTATEWVADAHIDDGLLLPIAVQTLVYVLLLFGATLVDFSRREL